MRSIEKIKQRSAEITKYNNRPKWLPRGEYKGETVYKHTESCTWKYKDTTYRRSGIISYLSNDGGIDTDDPVQYHNLLTFLGW